MSGLMLAAQKQNRPIGFALLLAYLAVFLSASVHRCGGESAGAVPRIEQASPAHAGETTTDHCTVCAWQRDVSGVAPAASVSLGPDVPVGSFPFPCAPGPSAESRLRLIPRGPPSA